MLPAKNVVCPVIFFNSYDVITPHHNTSVIRKKYVELYHQCLKNVVSTNV